MWYVIQVINGREDVMRERIERVVPASAMQELFYPQFQISLTSSFLMSLIQIFCVIILSYGLLGPMCCKICTTGHSL